MSPENSKKTAVGRPFQKGKSGNPGGRPKSVDDVKELARQYTTEAIEKLVDWLRSENPKASVSAAMALLDRGHGKPAQALEHGGTIRHEHEDVSARDELLGRIGVTSARVGTNGSAQKLN